MVCCFKKFKSIQTEVFELITIKLSGLQLITYVNKLVNKPFFQINKPYLMTPVKLSGSR